MASCRVGGIYLIDTTLSTPKKRKIALCLCLGPRLFVWFNSNPAPHGLDQLAVSAGCHDAITKDCFLDLSTPMLHHDIEVDEAAVYPKDISRALCEQIVARIEAGLERMPARYAALFLEALRELYDLPTEQEGDPA